jgi:hypothetical protein
MTIATVPAGGASGKLRHRGRKLRSLLCASVSSFAIGTVAANAADLVLKGPPAPWAPVTVWAEGGAFWTKNDPNYWLAPWPYDRWTNVTGVGGPGPGLYANKVGFEGALGVDYAFAASPWHVSFDMRFAESRADDVSLIGRGTGSGSGSFGAQTFSERANHGYGDFMVGRDIFGPNIQIKAGLRIAEVSTDLGQAFGGCSGSCSGAAGGAALLSTDERSTFIGAGPRFAVEGRYPTSGGWSVEYLAAAALLIGDRQLQMSGTAQSLGSGSGLGSLNTCTGIIGGSGSGSNCPAVNLAQSVSEFGAVLNAEAAIAIAYSFTQNSTVSVGFRVDAYFNSLKTVAVGGGFTNRDQVFYGPFARWAVRF